MKVAKKWVLVLDDSKAKILQKKGRTLVHVFPTSHAKDLVSPKNKNLEREGRVKESHEVVKHAYEVHEDYREKEANEFVAQISKIMGENLAGYDQLVIIASPKTLAKVREQLPEPVQRKIIAEIHKDLVKLPLKEIYQYIAESQT